MQPVLTRPSPHGEYLPLPIAGEGGVRSLFLEAHRDVAVRGQAHLVALDFGDEAGGDEVVMALVAPRSFRDLGTAVLLGQLDAVAFDAVDGADMHAVGA